MNLDYLTILTIVFSLLLLLIQRTEAQKRLGVIVIMILPGILLRNFILYRDVQGEAWAALGIALAFNFAFWLFIGRYNPVTSSDEIQVLGLDD